VNRSVNAATPASEELAALTIASAFNAVNVSLDDFDHWRLPAWAFNRYGIRASA